MSKKENQGGTTGAFFRINSDTYKNFVRKAQDSKVLAVKGQSQKEVVTERLFDLYIENGDAIWEWITKSKYNAKKELKNV